MQLMTNELPDLKLLYEGREADFQKLCVGSKTEIDKHTEAIVNKKTVVNAIVKAQNTTERNAKIADETTTAPKAKAKGRQRPRQRAPWLDDVRPPPPGFGNPVLHM